MAKRHHPLLKRIAVWTVASTLLLAWYVAFLPVAEYFCPRNRVCVSILRAAYEPVGWYLDRGLPGSEALESYHDRTYALLQSVFD